MTKDGMKYLRVVMLGIGLLGCAGCGNGKPAVAPVSGRVLYQGKPVKFGQVFFHPSGGTQGRGPIQPDGTFTLSTYGDKDGAQIAKHTVRVTCYEVQDPNADPKRLGSSNGKSLIPEKYASLTTTDLSEEVKAGPNTFEIVLKD